MAIIDNLDFTPTFRNNQVLSQYENFIFAENPHVDVTGRQNIIGQDCYNVTVRGDGNKIGNHCYNIRLINCTNCTVGEAEELAAASTDTTYTPINGVTLINCQNLTVNSSLVAYIQNSPFYGDLSQEKTTSFTASYLVGTYFCNASSGNITVTIPEATDYPYKEWQIVKTDSTANKVILTRSGSDLILGDTTLEITTQYESLKLKSDNKTNYYIF